MNYNQFVNTGFVDQFCKKYPWLLSYPEKETISDEELERRKNVAEGMRFNRLELPVSMFQEGEEMPVWVVRKKKSSSGRFMVLDEWGCEYPFEKMRLRKVK